MAPATSPSFLLPLLATLSWAMYVAAQGVNNTKLIFYFGPEFEDSVSYELSEATQVLTHPKFTNNETHCYMHGYRQSQDDESIHELVDAYHKRGTINFLTIDWAEAASFPYANAVDNVGELAPQLADMMLALFAAGLERESFTVVGHSLGGQLAGYTGREIIKKSNGAIKLHQMAVLDAAFPLFTFLSHKSVNTDDAEFLQAIHTDSGTYGQPFALGHVDFWPNGGQQGQPGCPGATIVPFSEDDLCSHQMSWRFWAESVANVDGPYFWAFSAYSYELLLFEIWIGVRNLEDGAIQMGINCPRDARGNYYLKTNSEPPYAMGFEGY